MTPDCLSSLAIDRLLAGELDQDELRRAEAHLLACTECRARREHAERYKARVVAELGTLGELRAPARPEARVSSRGRARVALGGLLALAAALLLFLHRTPEGAEEGPLTRTKGRGRLA